MEPKLFIELVPASQFGDNLRSRLPAKLWDLLRRATYEAAGNKCEICGGKGHKWPVECHEKWEYNEETLVQKLTGLIALCPACHEVKHIGLAGIRGRQEIALRHLAKVNAWTYPQALLHLKEAFEVWNVRSSKIWTLDLSGLESKEGFPRPPSDVTL